MSRASTDKRNGWTFWRLPYSDFDFFLYIRFVFIFKWIYIICAVDLTAANWKLFAFYDKFVWYLPNKNVLVYCINWRIVLLCMILPGVTVCIWCRWLTVGLRTKCRFGVFGFFARISSLFHVIHWRPVCPLNFFVLRLKIISIDCQNWSCWSCPLENQQGQIFQCIIPYDIKN